MKGYDFMWILLAIMSAFFAGVTAVLSKVGMKNINSNLGTAVRTMALLFPRAQIRRREQGRAD